jgi:hypothetical protein
VGKEETGEVVKLRVIEKEKYQDSEMKPSFL